MAEVSNPRIAKIIPLKYRIENLKYLIIQKRFLKNKEGSYTLMGGLTPDEYGLVKDYLIYNEKTGRYHTKNPKKIVETLLKNGKWQLDYLLSIKLHNAVIMGDKNDIYALNTVYSQLILQREGNENAIDTLKKAYFRGDMFEWRVLNNVMPTDISVKRIKTFKIGERRIAMAIFEDTKNKETYLQVTGESFKNSVDRFDNYAVVWRYEDARSVSNETLIRAFDLGKYADNYAYGVGEVKDIIEDSVGEFTLRGIISKVYRYNIIEGDVRESTLANAQLDLGNATKNIGMEEFGTEEEARKWLDTKFFSLLREVKEKFGDFKKQMEEIENMFKEYERGKEDDIEMMFG